MQPATHTLESLRSETPQCCRVLPDRGASGDDILDLVDQIEEAVGRPPIEQRRPRGAYLWRTDSGSAILLSPA